jgi:DNA-binding NarL/FixJ family response regulator
MRPHRAAVQRPEIPADPIHVVVVDHDVDSLDATVHQLRSAGPKIVEVGSFRSAYGALERIAENHPEVALIRLRMPEMDGICCAHKVKELSPATAVAITTATPTLLHFDPTVLSDVSAFLRRPLSRDELIMAIHAVATGFRLFSSGALSTLGRTRQTQRTAFVRESRLNSREVQVLDCLARGRQNKEIAGELGFSVPLTEKIIRAVFNKLQARKRAEAIVIWRSVG